MQQTTLIVGLGNPGSKYAHTRHNVGFDVVEVISQRMGIRLTRHRSRAIVGEGTWQGHRIALAQPQTYMNLSGESVAPLVQWYKVAPENLILIYDDVDLPPGAVRVRASGSAGTHNGMRSIVGLLGHGDFPRVRVGIGSPPPGWDMADWVTSHYPDAEARKVAFEGYLQAADAVMELVENGPEAAMRRFNRKPKPPKPPKPPKEEQAAEEADQPKEEA